ncbi:ABC transporter ATP-binding protein [Paenibacillus sp. GXUN7292]|uniref:ABC transporter ATP-binding protein n=1 Tax=Paenibacillus sp. GXUN7292 TaxID=3422499 RepID=UPI003D7C6463
MLSVQQLSIELLVNQKWLTAVRPLSFELKKGEIMGVIGESGSGKSLLAKAIMNILPNRARIGGGSLFINDTNVLELSSKERLKWNGKKIAYIFQNPAAALNPIITIGQQLIDAIYAHQKLSKAEAIQIAKQALLDVGIQDAERVFKSYPHEISGGMKQRAVIAIAVIHQPDLLIADEATTALDATIRKQVLDLFRMLSQTKKISILFISHDIAAVKYVADQVLVLYGGHMLEYGSGQAVLKHAKHPYTEDLLKATPYQVQAGERLKGIAGQVPPITQNEQGCIYKDRCKLAHDRCRAFVPEFRHPALESLHKYKCHLDLFPNTHPLEKEAGESHVLVLSAVT